MTSSFLVTLDTTAPALSITGARDVGEPSLLHLDVDFGDAIELKVWGDINPDGLENEGFGEDESAPWFAAQSPLLIRLADVENAELHVEARDDVWNIASVVESFPLHEEPTPEPIRPRPSPPRGPTPEPQPQRRSIERRASVRITADHTSRTRSGRTAATRLSTRREMRSEGPGHRRTARGTPVRFDVRRGHRVGMGHRSSVVGTTTRAIDRRSVGDPDFDILVALGLFP